MSPTRFEATVSFPDNERPGLLVRLASERFGPADSVFILAAFASGCFGLLLGWIQLWLLRLLTFWF